MQTTENLFILKVVYIVVPIQLIQMLNLQCFKMLRHCLFLNIHFDSLNYIDSMLT